MRPGEYVAAIHRRESSPTTTSPDGSHLGSVKCAVRRLGPSFESGYVASRTRSRMTPSARTTVATRRIIVAQPSPRRECSLVMQLMLLRFGTGLSREATV